MTSERFVLCLILFHAGLSHSFPGKTSLSGSCRTVDSKPQRLSVPYLSPFCSFPPSFIPSLLSSSPACCLSACVHPCHAKNTPSSYISAFTGCFPSSPLFLCALQMHQPGVRSCFLFPVRVNPTGLQPNESFPARYGEKITFRVWTESN